MLTKSFVRQVSLHNPATKDLRKRIKRRGLNRPCCPPNRRDVSLHGAFIERPAASDFCTVDAALLRFRSVDSPAHCDARFAVADREQRAAVIDDSAHTFRFRGLVPLSRPH